jgi:hypothetical protein
MSHGDEIMYVVVKIECAYYYSLRLTSGIACVHHSLTASIDFFCGLRFPSRSPPGHGVLSNLFVLAGAQLFSIVASHPPSSQVLVAALQSL